MSTFDDILVATAGTFTGTFGETVVYRPQAGGTRTIAAIVEREPAAIQKAVPGAQNIRLLLTVANDATRGIATSEFRPQTDRVSVAYRRGGTAEEFQIVGEPVWQDAGMVQYLLR